MQSENDTRYKCSKGRKQQGNGAKGNFPAGVDVVVFARQMNNNLYQPLDKAPSSCYIFFVNS